MNLKDKNLSFLKRDMPELFSALEKYEAKTKYIDIGEMAPNIQREDGSFFYPFAANKYAQKQLNDFYQSPSRLVFGKPDESEKLIGPDLDKNYKFLTQKYDDRATDDHYASYVFDVTKIIRKHEVKVAVKPTDGRAYYLTVWGVGLGYHLKPLLEKYQPEWLILLDESLDGIYHSLNSIDWEDFVGSAKLSGVKVKICVEKTVESFRGKLTQTIQTESLLGIDGLLAYQHLTTPLLKIAYSEFNSHKTANLAQFIGFTVDEYNMMKNSFRNLREGSKRMLDRTNLKLNKPVLIVGSGPSLEKNIDFVKKNQDKVIIFSSGSSLKVLLKNGIKPDVHSNLERANSIYQRHIELEQEGFDLKNIWVVLTTTIWPGIDKFFKSAVYFLRPALSPLAVYCENDAQVLMGEGPQVTNTAFAFSARLEPSEIYLLGVDLGTTDPQAPRAKDAWQGIRPRQLTIPMRGNAGKTVMTDASLLQQKLTLEGLIRKNKDKFKVFNLGDGIKIEGALSRRIEDVSLEKSIENKDKFVDELMMQFPVYTRERFLAAWESAAVRDSIAHMCNSMIAHLESDRPWDNKLIKILEDINQYINKPIRQQYAPRLLRGSVLRILMHANSVILRVPASKRDEITSDIRQLLVEKLRALEFEAYSLADELESEDERFKIEYH